MKPFVVADEGGMSNHGDDNKVMSSSMYVVSTSSSSAVNGNATQDDLAANRNRGEAYARRSEFLEGGFFEFLISCPFWETQILDSIRKNTFGKTAPLCSDYFLNDFFPSL